MALLRNIAIAAGILLSPFAAQADYPEKPVKVVVPFAPGSGSDTLMRLMAQKLSDGSGRSFVVENKPGAGGNIGVQSVATSPADGYTVVMASPSTVINPLLSPSTGYAMADLAPVATWARTPLLLLANPSTGISSLKALIDNARANPGKLNYGSGGIGLPQFMVMELLKQKEKLNIVHVAYKGSAPAMTAILGGQVQVAADTIVTALPQVQAGKLTALAITTLERSPLAPNIPTVAELGFPSIESVAFISVLAPAKTPADVLDKLNGMINTALKDADTVKRIRDLGADPFITSRREFASYLVSETNKWGAVIKEQGIKAE
jgi:tripartite-type tricarboxylate transporter receptor subunit TctC